MAICLFVSLQENGFKLYTKIAPSVNTATPRCFCCALTHRKYEKLAKQEKLEQCDKLVLLKHTLDCKRLAAFGRSFIAQVNACKKHSVWKKKVADTAAAAATPTLTPYCHPNPISNPNPNHFHNPNPNPSLQPGSFTLTRGAESQSSGNPYPDTCFNSSSNTCTNTCTNT